MNKIFQNKKIIITSVITVVLLALVGSFFIFRDQGQEVEAADWFDEMWYYRQSIEVGNVTTTLTDFQVKILDGENFVTNIDNGKMQLDLDDIRFTDGDAPCLEGIADGCADIKVVTTGTLSAFGIPDMMIQEEVDAANLRKFSEGGYRREDGKWMKPPDWTPPDIDGILELMGWEGDGR